MSTKKVRSHANTAPSHTTPRRSAKVIRYAVVGLGHIAQSAVLPAFANATKNSRLAALVSGDSRKLRALGDRYSVDARYSYDQFHRCLERGEVDAVYIALPNSLHEEFTIAAARARVHVLCEKPLAVTDRQCDAMVRACDRAGVLLMTAYRLHFEAANLKVLELCRSRKLGDLRIFNSSFTQQVKKGNSRLHARLGSSPLSDVGIYCINAARMLFGSEPTEVIGWDSTSSDPRFREVPETTSAMMRFAKGQIASFSCSFGAAPVSHYRIIGTKGVAELECAYDYGYGATMRTEIDGVEHTRQFSKKDQFGAQLLYFSQCIINRRKPEPSGEEGAADVRVIRAIEWSIERGRSAYLSRIASLPGPSIRQVISRPPIKPPPIIDAHAPTRD